MTQRPPVQEGTKLLQRDTRKQAHIQYGLSADIMRTLTYLTKKQKV
jgi:hypothetical protein